MKHILSMALLLCSFVSNAQTDEMDYDLHIIKNVYAKYAIDEHPTIPADTDLVGIWKMKEDIDRHNYFVLERYEYADYAFTYMNREGSNRTFENVPTFFSKIGNTEFLNVRYHDWKGYTSGYFFLKITDRDSRGWDMTLQLIADTTLKNIPDREGVRERLAKNINNPKFFKKPVHFHKILPLMYCK
jgi:hypothetical protein